MEVESRDEPTGAEVGTGSDRRAPRVEQADDLHTDIDEPLA